MPILVEGSSQTELKHPKNVYTQYEPRVFTDEEVATIWESDEMKKFMIKVTKLFLNDRCCKNLTFDKMGRHAQLILFILPFESLWMWWSK